MEQCRTSVRGATRLRRLTDQQAEAAASEPAVLSHCVRQCLVLSVSRRDS